MEENNNTSRFTKFNEWIQRSVTIKLLSIGVLILILLIPASMIETVIRERQYARDAAITEVSSKWGEAQLVAGPILSVPDRKNIKNDKGKIVEIIEFFHCLPDSLGIEGVIRPERRYRGIYDVVVYNTELKLKGFFGAIDLKELNIDSADVIWEDARLNLGVTDMRGIQKSIELSWNTDTSVFDPGLSNTDVLESGVSTSVVIAENIEKFDFSLDLNLNGSGSIQFLPLGKVTTLGVNSTWQNPKFDGAFLPDSRNISEQGFTANWEVLHLNRNFPQKWIGNKHQVIYSSFGVNLLLPVDQYQKSMRSAKYAIMFIALTFMILFFTEILNRKRIHPFQYILTGLALCIFYLLLISLSEHIGFNNAYLVSSIAIIAMVTLYASTIFKQKKLTLLTGGVIAILYAFLFITLQLQDYALLMGSIGLFLVMGLVMYISRKVDWYKIAER